MVTTYIVCSVLLLVAAWSKGVQDSIAHHNSLKARGQWWDSDISWQWKYAANSNNTREKFWGSTRWFVFVTDAWHCFAMVNMSAWQMALCLLLPVTWQWQIAAFVGAKVVYGTLFEATYRHLNNQKP